MDNDSSSYIEINECSIKSTKRPYQHIESPVVSLKCKNRLDSSRRDRSQNATRYSLDNHKKIKSSHDSLSQFSNKDVKYECKSGSVNGGALKPRTVSVSSPGSKRELERNPDILDRRQKQIDYGKNTLGYDRYLKSTPKHERTKDDPKTPPKNLQMSRRAWDGLVKNWRIKLHNWDPSNENEIIDYDNMKFDQYSFSSEDPSSYESNSLRSDSTPSTPRTSENYKGSELCSWTENIDLDDSTKMWSNSDKNVKTESDEYLGCEPLPEQFAKAYS